MSCRCAADRGDRVLVAASTTYLAGGCGFCSCWFQLGRLVFQYRCLAAAIVSEGSFCVVRPLAVGWGWAVIEGSVVAGTDACQCLTHNNAGVFVGVSCAIGRRSPRTGKRSTRIGGALAWRTPRGAVDANGTHGALVS